MANYLITGASGGMGSAVCRLLSERGHRVWGIDRKAPAVFSKGWTNIQADVTSREDLQEALQMVKTEVGSLDGIIHTAGVYDLNSLVEMPEEDFLRDFNINLFGMYRVNKLFLPLLKRPSRIVIISNELAPLYPLPFTGIYAITKTAVEKYAASLRMELQLLGHQVVVVRPGAVRTNMLPASTERLSRFCRNTSLYKCNAARFKRIVDSVEARSIPPDEIAQVVYRALTVKRPRLVYNINRNPLLLMLDTLPVRLQLWIIKKVLE